ncbi:MULTISPECIES: energy-coupling factor ABC transporter substrate-binding protein [unclassified Microcoleus]|uniref:energy-coupling factor ABC transporter substrate-binding protein n=1 Tax=unclassified Microcoleus TaxID=2642155 RepID=UPI0025DC0A92|nr:MULTISPECIES: energy-coupling factor ABC transporter substrate-binding protein [unclassified Microcoleus]
MNQKPTKNQQASSQQNWMLVIGVVALAVIPLVFVRGEYGGSDDQAKKAITEIQPSYKPWFNHLFEPASSEIASLLFASQAAVGAGVVGYAIGLYKGRSQSQQSDDKSPLE